VTIADDKTNADRPVLLSEMALHNC